MPDHGHGGLVVDPQLAHAGGGTDVVPRTEYVGHAVQRLAKLRGDPADGDEIWSRRQIGRALFTARGSKSTFLIALGPFTPVSCSRAQGPSDRRPRVGTLNHGPRAPLMASFRCAARSSYPLNSSANLDISQVPRVSCFSLICLILSLESTSSSSSQ